jgi:hypothetical protein
MEVCPNCRAVKQKRHAGLTCEQFNALPKYDGWIPQMFLQARKWARRNWGAGLPVLTAVDPNPCLFNKCRSLRRFIEGTGSADPANPLQGLNTFFAWHGSSRDGVIGICCEGWKPSRRAGQSFGRGEYFGPTAQVSYGYCRGCAHMIVAIIIRNQSLHDFPGQCFVVDNPGDDNGPCFCLPIAVVSFGQPMNGWKHPMPADVTFEEEDDDTDAPHRHRGAAYGADPLGAAALPRRRPRGPLVYGAPMVAAYPPPVPQAGLAAFPYRI